MLIASNLSFQNLREQKVDTSISNRVETLRSAFKTSSNSPQNLCTDVILDMPSISDADLDNIVDDLNSHAAFLSQLMSQLEDS